ncbi:MAG: hypothetical protein HY821_04650 [Acidobacteria bacterium]|nr:hypothetical protein [Acidobacteriota bacterium]
MKTHPTLGQLALLAGGECGRAARLRLGWHLRSCENCRVQVEQFRNGRAALRAEAEALPAGLDWAVLEAEMRANVRLGLAAGAVVGKPRETGRTEFQIGAGWRLAVVLGSMAFVGLAGWMLRAPQHGLQAVAPAETVQLILDARPDGLALRNQDSAVTLIAPSRRPVATAVSWDGGGSARFVDADTGQVTIYDVSAQ